MDVRECFKHLAAQRRPILLLVALLTTFAGADLSINRPKGWETQWLAIPFLAFGAGVFAWAVWPRGVTPTANRPSLAGRLLFLLSLRGRLVPYFLFLGIAIIVADLAYNATLSATPALLTEDTILLLGGVSLIVYGFVPSQLARERDFVLVFFLMLNAILVAPLLILRTFYADFERSVDFYSWVALAHQTSAVLSLIGVSNTVHSVAGSTAPGITFSPVKVGGPVTVVITATCSGIYSFGIFASAFIAFILTEYKRPSKRIWALLALGFSAAYAANVLRMVVIVLVGYFADTAETELQNMLIAHSYAGWLIFLGWVALFWSAVLRFFPAVARDSLDANQPHPVRPEATCGICGEILTPAIPATRCECGSYRHRVCISKAVDCPACGRPTTSEGSALAGGT